MKTVSPTGNFFLMNSSFRLVETNFLSSRNSIVLFRALLKVLGVATFLRETYYFCSWKLIFWLVKVNFFHFLGTPASERYFLSGENVFLHKFFIPYRGGGFSVLRKPFSLI